MLLDHLPTALFTAPTSQVCGDRLRVLSYLAEANLIRLKALLLHVTWREFGFCRLVSFQGSEKLSYENNCHYPSPNYL